MTIHKLNYEHFVLDYLEGNLSEELQNEMIAFLQKNPRIQTEIQGVQEYVLSPDTSITYNHTESLLKEEPVPFIFNYKHVAAVLLFLIGSVTIFYVYQQEEMNLPTEKNIVKEDVKETQTERSQGNTKNVQQAQEVAVVNDVEDIEETKNTELQRISPTQLKEVKNNIEAEMTVRKKPINIASTPINEDDKSKNERQERHYAHISTSPIASLPTSGITKIEPQSVSNIELIPLPSIQKKTGTTIDIAGREVDLKKIKEKLDYVIEEGKEKGLISETVSFRNVTMSSLTIALIPESFYQ